MPGAGAGPGKLRPALVPARLPGSYQDVLLCGISTRKTDLVPDWDEVMDEDGPDFRASGLHKASTIRPSFLGSAESSAVAGAIGRVDGGRLKRILARLARHISAAAGGEVWR
jgi:mRNA interferase MazF